MEDTTPVHPAEAAEADALTTPRTLTFGEGDEAITVDIPRKWKRFKFMRALTRSDIGTALEAVWPPSPSLGPDGKQRRDPVGNLLWDDHPTLLLLEEAEITQEEFDETLNKLGAAVTGMDPGNSGASQS